MLWVLAGIANYLTTTILPVTDILAAAIFSFNKFCREVSVGAKCMFARGAILIDLDGHRLP
jgi:hypothetical protein